MKVEETKNGIAVSYQKLQVGHKPSVKYLRLSNEERAKLAQKIKDKVPFDDILDEIKESVTSTNYETLPRIYSTDKQDLKNIMRACKLDMDKAHQDDAWSLHFWVEEQMKLGEDRSVLFYKRQGVEDPFLQKNDFMLVIMDKFQREEMAKFSKDKILIDGTHNMTQHDFYLNSLVTIDEFGAGFPLAYCISSKQDTTTFELFFQAVKDAVGNIEATVFMTDDYPAYINAWNKVMNSPVKYQLLCTWHVDRNWRQNLPKIKDITKQSEVYKYCRTLLETTDADVFNEGLSNFLVVCAKDLDTREFGTYFGKHYASRCEQWAFCYRLSLGLNTNMYLESIHKNLKYVYLNGKKGKRVDKLVSILLRFTRDLMGKRIVRFLKNTPTHRMREIGRSHKKSREITDSMIIMVNEGVWTVESSEHGKNAYKVSITSHSCQGCPLSCPVCKVCVHKMECTCVNYLIQGNMCKHIHACIRFSRQTNTENLVSLQKPAPEPGMTPPIITEEGYDKAATAALRCSQSTTSVHVGQAVSDRGQMASLLTMLCDLAPNVQDDAVPELKAMIEQCVLKAQKSCNDSACIPQLPPTPKCPSHCNIQPQRFFSVKKKLKKVERKFSKPTESQKRSLLEAMNNHIEDNVHTGFDHQY